MYVFLQINITKSPTLKTKIIYTKKFNNDDIKQF